MLFDILLTLLFVFLNAFFVAAEFAIVKVRASQLELRARFGGRLAKRAFHIVVHLDQYLSATQLGITLASLGLGWIGEAVVSEMVRTALTSLSIQLDEKLLHQLSFVLAFFTITVLHIVLGELAPKSFAIQKSEQTALLVSFPLQIFYIVFKPFIWSLNKVARLLLKAVGLNETSDRELHSADELRLLLEEGAKSGEIEEGEHELIENVFAFSEIDAKQIMVPRMRMVGVDISFSGKEVIEVLMEEGYSRLPVFDGTPDKIVGVVYAKDIIALTQHQELIVLQDILRPVHFVGENERIKSILKELQRKRMHLAIVQDQFGGTAGLVTLEDILEELVGEIQDEYDDEASLVEKISAVEFVVKAQTGIHDLNEFLPIPILENDEYETLAGFINYKSGRIPDLNETIETEHYQCTVLQRTDRILVSIRLTLKTSLK